MLANWMMVIITACAAWAAFRAAAYAKGAWRSQAKQERHTRRQLGIAIHQNERALESHERERRALAPDFRVKLLAAGTPVSFGANGDHYRSGEGYCFWQEGDRIDPVFSPGGTLIIPLVDIKSPQVRLREWKAWFADGTEIMTNEFHSHYPLFSDGRKESGFVLIVPFEVITLPDKDLFISFETQTGFLDTQKFTLRVIHCGTQVSFMELKRIEPSGVTSGIPALSRRVDGEAQWS